MGPWWKGHMYVSFLNSSCAAALVKLSEGSPLSERQYFSIWVRRSDFEDEFWTEGWKKKKKKAIYWLNTSILVTCYAVLYLYTTMTEAAFWHGPPIGGELQSILYFIVFLFFFFLFGFFHGVWTMLREPFLARLPIWVVKEAKKKQQLRFVVFNSDSTVLAAFPTIPIHRVCLSQWIRL